MKTGSNIQMTFTCNEDWDTMKVTSCGKFCDVCKKEVIDFTKKPLSEFDHLKGQEFCGRFSVEQLDSSLIKQIQFPFSKKIASTLLL
ncbi:MAG: hypothetical protein ACXVPU_14805 [Bacteroidia bacterium]